LSLSIQKFAYLDVAGDICTLASHKAWWNCWLLPLLLSLCM